MWCCLPFCENSRENLFSKTCLRSQDITFHGFPTIGWQRSSWLASLDIEECHLPEDAVVCSQHFQNEDFLCGTRILKNVAIPYTAQFCMICLDTGSKLYPFDKYRLAEAYNNVTGLSLHSMVSFQPKLCWECAQRLMNSNKFRDKCARAHNLLVQVLANHGMVTTQNVKTINRVQNHLASNISKKIFETNHCDLHIINEEDKENDFHNVPIENIVVSVEKTEIKLENEYNKEDILTCDFDSDGYSNDDIDLAELLKENSDKQNIDKENRKNLDTDARKTLETIKIDKQNIDDFINNDVFTEVEFSNGDYNSDKKVSNSKSKKNGKVISKCKVSKEVSLKNKIVKKKKRVKSEIKGRPGRKPGFKEELKLFKVTELAHEEQLAEILKRKETSNFKNSPYKCTTCYKGFCDTSAYNRHMDKHTNKFGQFACPVCGLHTKNTYRVNKHLNNTHAARYNCTVCTFITRSRNSAKAHERWHDGKKYKCPHCEEEFIKSTSYMSHVRIKHPSDFVCTQCGFSFIGERGLRMHMNMKHRFDAAENPEGPTCEECNIRFASEMAYHQHMKVSPKHATADTFKLNYPVRKICRRNQPRPTKPGLKREPVPTPKTMGPVDCEQCGVKLKGSRSYAMHFKKYHPDKNRTKFPKARIMCEQCGKIFTCMAHLRYHMPIHADTKQFKCDTCDKRFAFKANLMNHIVIHDTSRPRFECTVCGKNFSNQQNRWRHMFLHKGIKFKCEICDKTFNTDPQRALHVAHVHMKVPWPKRNRGPRAKTHHVRHTMYTSDSQDS
ncbi:zinc finger protein 83-like [Maniola hyperantus]|uniref:zinc finger protein 83-like n=1 Tax=Aphantopus hyperantus TaxID=2795564 RepID=UPI00156A43C6|nr:zinc finger protein 676-like [Maniola hyperantus]